MSPRAVFCSLRTDLDRIALDLTGAPRIALDIETYGDRKGDGLDPWKGDIRLLTISRQGGTIWTIDLRAIGYELGPIKPILEEAGIECVSLQLRGTVSWPGFGKHGEDWFGFIFLIDTWTGTPKAENPEGTLTWIAVEKRLPCMDIRKKS